MKISQAFDHNSENNPQNGHRFETPLFIKEVLKTLGLHIAYTWLAFVTNMLIPILMTICTGVWAQPWERHIIFCSQLREIESSIQDYSKF